jgi:hypothetical protein
MARTGSVRWSARDSLALVAVIVALAVAVGAATEGKWIAVAVFLLIAGTNVATRLLRRRDESPARSQ